MCYPIARIHTGTTHFCTEAAALRCGPIGLGGRHFVMRPPDINGKAESFTKTAHVKRGDST